MSLYAHVQKNISHYYKMFKHQTSAQYAKETLLGVGIVVSAVVGYGSYSFYVKKREQRAFGALVEVIDSFERTKYEVVHPDEGADKKNNVNMWQDTEILIEALYKQNSSSYLAPYFLIFKSEVALERGAPIEEVLKILEYALSKIPTGTAFFELYNLKRILLSFDSLDETVRKEALHDLIATAKDEKSYSFEEASYLLGIYYISQGNMPQARETFENLLKFADTKALLPSPWVKQAEEKLESIKHA